MMISVVPASAESCDCVIFRFVDVQDFYLTPARIAVMDTFINEDEKVSLSIILNGVGFDQTIVDKVEQGQQSGHFELTLHGYNHEDFTNFDFAAQKNLMELSQSKMQSLWGVNSTSFVPPMHQYNDDTLQVIKDLDISIISSGPQGIDPPENIKFIANTPSNITDSFGNYHLPQTAEFYDHGTFPHTKIPHDDIMVAVDAAVLQYGYAVLNLYGTDFAQRDGGGNFLDITNSTEINDLLAIFNAIDDNGYTTTTFSEITKVNVVPVLDSIGSQSVNNLELLSFTATATDSDIPVHTLAFSLRDGISGALPAGASITASGDFTWTPSEGQDGDYTFDVVVNDNDTPNLSDSETITVTVGEIPNGNCVVPNGDWNIVSNCVLSSNANISGNVIIQNNSVLTIPSGVALTISSGNNITIESGSGVSINFGGTLQVNF